jgi:hypothetical protein
MRGHLRIGVPSATPIPGHGRPQTSRRGETPLGERRAPGGRPTCPPRTVRHSQGARLDLARQPSGTDRPATSPSSPTRPGRRRRLIANDSDRTTSPSSLVAAEPASQESLKAGAPQRTSDLEGAPRTRPPGFRDGDDAPGAGSSEALGIRMTEAQRRRWALRGCSRMVGRRCVAFGGLGLVEGGIGMVDHRVGAGGGEPDAGADGDGERAVERDGRFDRRDDSLR